MGAVSKDGLRNRATNPTKLPDQKSEEFDFQSLVIENLDKHVHILAENAQEGQPTIGLLSRILDITPYVVIGREVPDNLNKNSKLYFLDSWETNMNPIDLQNKNKNGKTLFDMSVYVSATNSAKEFV